MRRPGLARRRRSAIASRECCWRRPGPGIRLTGEPCRSRLFSMLRSGALRRGPGAFRLRRGRLFVGLGQRAQIVGAADRRRALRRRASGRRRIELAPGAITYWRNPGDAGLPPTLSFEGSSNLAQARTSFPAPRRLPEGSGEAFGYDGGLIFPIDMKR